MKKEKQLALNKQSIETLDTQISKRIGENSPGCIVAIVRDGETIFSKAYGYANLDHMVPVTKETSFYIASVSKQFTAMSVLLLAEQGLVNLDTSIREYLPDLPEYTETITLKHLLHHTSGLREYIDLISMKGQFNNLVFDNITMDEIYALLLQQKDVVSDPGEKYKYNNTGYILLARLVEKVSGKSFADFTQEHIFAPLGMDSAHFIQDPYQLISGYAQGYRDINKEYTRFPTRSPLVGPTGLVCKLDDMLKWDRFLSEGGLGIGEWNFLDMLQEPGSLSDGSALEYSYGMLVNEYKGRKRIWHDGSLYGYDASYVKFIDDNLSLIILSNVQMFGSSQLANELVDILFNEPSNDEQQAPSSEEAITKPVFVSIDNSRVVGIYRSRKSKSAIIVETTEDGILMNILGFNGAPHKYSPTAENDYVLTHRSDSSLLPPKRLVFVAEGESTALDIYYGEEVTTTYDFLRPLEDVSITPSGIEGIYYCSELDVFYRVSVDTNELIMHTGSSKLTFLQITENEFTYDQNIMEIQRNKSDEVTGLIFYSGRSEGVVGLDITKLKCDNI
ncbi:MAG: serine hydrolase domain-containing protein [Candidatus Thorarchaeota archaeon]